MENQEIFDKALKGIIEQGEPALKDGKCVYFDKETKRMCAAGQVLGPELAKKLQELVGDSFWGSPIFKGETEDTDFPFDLEQTQTLISSIQKAHDNPAIGRKSGASFIDKFKENMRDVAKKHGLELTE